MKKRGPSATQLRDEFFQAMGRALSLWQLTEFGLYRLFCILLVPAKDNLLSAAYFSITSFEGRLKMLENVGIEHFKTDEERSKDWLRMMDHCRKRNLKRNRLAHDMVVFDLDSKEHSLQFSMHNRVLMNRPSAPAPMKLKDLTDFMDEIVELNLEIENEIQRLFQMLKQKQS